MDSSFYRPGTSLVLTSDPFSPPPSPPPPLHLKRSPIHLRQINLLRSPTHSLSLQFIHFIHLHLPLHFRFISSCEDSPGALGFQLAPSSQPLRLMRTSALFSTLHESTRVPLCSMGFLFWGAFYSFFIIDYFAVSLSLCVLTSACYSCLHF